MFDSDDEDFTPSPSSKLASIFGLSSTPDSSNTTLTYKAPKQPKPGSSNPIDPNQTVMKNKLGEGPTQTQSSVMFAKVVTLWKVENGNNKHMGRYMVAIGSNPLKAITELLIYQDKSNILVRETLGKSLLFLKYPNNFTACCDSYKQLWNLGFDTHKTKDLFLQYIGNFHCTIQEEHNSTDKDETDETKSMRDPKKSDSPCDITDVQVTREDIFSRVTKMGQQILPRTMALNKSSELSDYESESSCTETTKPVTAPRKIRKTPGSTDKALTVAPITPEVSSRSYATPFSNNNFFVPQNQMIHAQNPTGLMYSQPIPDYGLSHFVINQNSELKASLAEINVKLNNVLISTDKNGNGYEDTSVLNSKIKCQNLKIDNLNSELYTIRNKFQDLNIKYGEKCKELVEIESKNKQSGLLESQINSLRQKVNHSEALLERLEKLESDVKIKDEKINILNFDLKTIEQQLTEAKSYNEIISKKNSELMQQLLDLNELNKENGEKNSLDKEKISKIVKEGMNEAFRGIMDSFSDNESYNTKQIEAVLLQNLKKTSFKLINSVLS